MVEKSAEKVIDLKNLKAKFPEISSRIHIRRGDANDELKTFCEGRDWNAWRGVVFLDPFGNQVSWRTLEKIAGTNGIDLWYLFPAGPGVHRQISNAGTVDPTHEESLDRLVGTQEWRSTFLTPEVEGDLFDSEKTVIRKTATPESITRFMIERMKGPFGGRVLDQWLPLSTRGIKYSLIFASANPSPKSWELASRLAGAVLRSQMRGRT